MQASLTETSWGKTRTVLTSIGVRGGGGGGGAGNTSLCLRMIQTCLVNKIKTDLENVHKWLIANKLTLNQEKTECMLIGSRQRLQQSLSNPQIVIGNHVMQQFSSKKVLGVIIRKLTRVRRRRQDDCYQYNDSNPTAQKKYIIKSLTVV